MKSYKSLLNSLSNDSVLLRKLTDNETKKLRIVLLKAFQDLAACCEKNNITVMLIGGTALGAVRHKGFIPWDDDLDVAIPRADFERLKVVFEKELGDNYCLSSPNYHNNACNRFPMMLVKDTLLVEAGAKTDDDSARIKIDIFVIENIPNNMIHRKLKGLWCTMLMAMGSYEETYEHNDEKLMRYMCSTDEGRREYRKRIRLGRLFSFKNFQQWMSIIDKACQYNRETNYLGIPSGRGHYFGETRLKETFLPVSKGEFEGIIVNLPGVPHDYLYNLYGADYMTIPSEEKRETHFIIDIKFKGEV